MGLQRLATAATILRSKNAGPFRLTLDVVFASEETYAAVVASGRISPATVAAAYGLAEEEVTDFVEFAPGRAIKITIPRLVSSGAPGDSDVYGAQQAAPLLDLMVPVPRDVDERQS